MGEESKIEKLFKSMDKNGDGFVTKEVSLFWELIRQLSYQYCKYNAEDHISALKTM